MSDSEHQNIHVPGTSVEKEHGPDADSLHSEASKQRLKTALDYALHLLAENDLIASESSAVITEEHIQIGSKIHDNVVELLSEYTFVCDDELIWSEEVDERGEYEKVEGVISVSSDDDYEPDEKRMKEDPDFIPLDYKIMVVNLAKAHPKWSLKSLQTRGAHRLKYMRDLKIWKEHIKQGGTRKDKYNTIDTWTYDRFVEARKCSQQVTTRNLQQWALAAASQFPDLEFKASATWIKEFKQRHHIRQRKVTNFVSERETATIEETLSAAENFRVQVRALIPNYHKDFVINTDQTGCQYQSTYNRTLENQGSKAVLVKRKDMNKVTHSYTAQYAMSLSGRLLPRVYVCLQESTGSFGPRVKQSVDEYAAKYGNVVITSSKSGKLSTALYKNFLTDVMKPYAQENKFLLLIDSWGGQTNPGLYDEIFQDKEGLPTCSIKVIPPKCTPLVQPCDVYFYRQVKNFIKKIQNCSYLIEREKEITSREDCIKIHSIVHHQLSSPIFGDMLRYAWFAAKLCDDRESFINVNQACFSMDTLKQQCNCKNAAFITCARCRHNYCFPCFYDEYHPSVCHLSPV